MHQNSAVLFDFPLDSLFARAAAARLLGLLLGCPDELKVVRLAADGDAVGKLHIPTQFVLVPIPKNAFLPIVLLRFRRLQGVNADARASLEL